MDVINSLSNGIIFSNICFKNSYIYSQIIIKWHLKYIKLNYYKQLFNEKCFYIDFI